MGVASFTLRPLYHQGRSPWYPLYRRLGGLHSQSECKEKYFQLLLGLEPLIILPLAQCYTTELSQLFLKYH
jgi:hypothetical protein